MQFSTKQIAAMQRQQTESDKRRAAKQRRVVPPTAKQLTDWRYHCALRTPKAAYTSSTHLTYAEELSQSN